MCTTLNIVMQAEKLLVRIFGKCTRIYYDCLKVELQLLSFYEFYVLKIYVLNHNTDLC